MDGSLGEWKPPGKITKSGTHYILDGKQENPLVMCIHGLGCYYAHFEALSKVLVAGGYCVLRYDMIGRGFSAPSELYDREAHLSQIRDLLEELNLSNRPRHVIGHSMGGAVAVLHANEFPDSILSLILFAPAGLLDGTLFTIIRSLWCFHFVLGAYLRSQHDISWRRDFYGNDDSALQAYQRCLDLSNRMYQHNPHTFPAIFNSLLQFPLSGLNHDVAQVGSRPVRILLLWGDHDIVVPIEQVEVWRKALGGGDARAQVETAWVRDAGHSFQMQRPAETADAVLRFLSAPPAGAPLAPAPAPAPAGAAGGDPKKQA